MFNFFENGWDKDELDKLVNDGYITRRRHPNADIYILNYTARAQYDELWNKYTLQCRGLIMDGNGNVIARPFTKFFNYEEHQRGKFAPLPDERFRVLEKLDGCLGILYKIDGVPYIASRGSFTSEFAVEATNILRERYADFEYVDGHTYLFELISPISRIVIDYEGKRDLVLLGIIDNQTGESVAELKDYPFEVVKSYPSAPVEVLAAMQRPGHEGFVLQYVPSGVRVKIKHDEYKRLHRILTETSTTVIWEVLAVESMAEQFPELSAKDIGDYLKHIDKTKVQPIMDQNGKALDSLIENVPDEFYSWLKRTVRNLANTRNSYIVEATAFMHRVGDKRKMVELAGKNERKRALALALFDGKIAAANGLAWVYSKPEWTKPFAREEA